MTASFSASDRFWVVVVVFLYIDYLEFKLKTCKGQHSSHGVRSFLVYSLHPILVYYLCMDKFIVSFQII